MITLRNISSLFALLIACTFPHFAFSQIDPLEETWRWTKFTTSSGLPSNNVRNVQDGPDGTPWAWTRGGLVWYDGFQWHKVDSTRHFAGNILGVISGFLREGVVLRINDAFFIGTRSGITPFPIDSVSNIWILNQDTAIITRNHLYHSYSQGALYPISPPWWKSEVRTGGNVSSEHILFLSGDTLFLWNGRKQFPLIYFNDKKNKTCTDVFSVNSQDQGILVFVYPRSQEGIWEWNRHGSARRDVFRTVRRGLLAAIAENGDAMVVYENNFVRARRNGKWKTLNNLPDFVRDISCIEYRLNGDLWVATDHGLFLCRFSAQPWSMHNWEETDPRNRVNNIIRSRDGSLWLATTGGVVQILPNGKTISMNVIQGKKIGIVTGLVEDHEQNIWISSGADFTGAYRWNGKKWRHFPIRFRDQDVQVHRIASDSKGRLWFLCLSSGWDPRPAENPGVFIFQDGIMKRWNESDNLPHQRVYAFAEGKDGALWFGTYGGLSRWKNGKWKVWKFPDGPIPGPVITLAIDESNRVWFGIQYQGPGVGMLDNTGEIRYFTTADGLPDNYAWDVKVDAKQRVWVTTQKGLACYSHNKWLTFDERTGLNDAMLWPVLPEDSVVIIGTLTNGWAELHLNRTDEDDPHININQPIIEENHAVIDWNVYAAWGNVSPENILTRYRINDNEWSKWSTTHNISLKDMSPGDYTLHVQAKGLFGQYDEDGQSILFTIQPPLIRRWYFYIPASVTALIIFGLVFQLYQRRKKYVQELGKSEERYRIITELMSDYAYLYRVRDDATLDLIWMTDSFTRLSGYPTHIANEPGFMQRYIHPDDLEQAYSNHRRLLQGENMHIEQRVITKSGKTVWVERRSSPVFNKDEKRVEFIYGVVHDITERKESEQRMRSLAGELVKTEERERRRMATFLHDVIGQSLTLTYLKLHRWQNKERPDDRMLDEIRIMLDQIIQDTHSLTFDLCPPIIYELSLGDALAWLVTRIQKQHDAVIQTEIDDEKIFVTQELHVLLFQAVRELIVNSIKHAKATCHRLEMHRTDNLLQIVVSDDGIGFDTGVSGVQIDKEGGFGLFNIKERLSDFGARLEIDSTPGKGTQITISTRIDEEKILTARIPNTTGDLK